MARNIIQSTIHNPQQLIDEGLEHFNHFHDPDMKCELYTNSSVH
jgi:hypothetical protein